MVPSPPEPGVRSAVNSAADETHTVTQADVDAGQVTDTATATGIDTAGDTSPASAPSTATVQTAAPHPAVSMVKIADASAGDTTSLTVGETIAYSYLVTNTGNVTLASLAVNDPSLGAVTCPVPASPGLAPGASETCTADQTHTVTQADVDAGQVADTATASGIDTTGMGSPLSEPSTVVVPQPANPAVAIDKTATVSPAADQHAAKVGDTIAYSYQVTDTGNVTLASLAVSDPSLGPVTCPTPAPPGLAPGASETCTADRTYTVTQADIDAGQVADMATASGTDTQGQSSPISAPSSVTTPTTAAAPAVSLLKIGTVSPAADQHAAKVGDIIAYSFQVTNTGNVTLASLAVSDPTGGAVTCPTLAAPGLAPGHTVTCTGNTGHLVSQADRAAGRVVDTATASGTDTRGTASPPSEPSTATTLVSASSPSQPTQTLPTGSAPTQPAATSGSPTSNAAVAAKAAATTADPSGHPADLTSAATADPPTGLGSIPTDLGRWMPGGHGLRQIAGGFALLVAGGALVIVRRQRRGLKQR